MQTHYSFAGFMGKRVHLGVTGSIAAYKVLDLVRAYQEADCMVSATLTDSASRFIGQLSFEALGASPVYGPLFAGSSSGETAFDHLEPGQISDVMVIAPASANSLAKLAYGMADDMLSCQALAFAGPKIIAPAMNPRMWNNPATKRNWEMLGELGYTRIEPECGHVACGDEGQGRFPSVDDIFIATLKALSPQDLAGKKVMVTLGPTRESWDAVRYWSNPSTGTMGACLAMAAYLRGADVTVIAGPHNLKFPKSITMVNVTTARAMFEAATLFWPSMDIGVATAAVADFRPVPHGAGKFKKSGVQEEGFTIRFEPNPDILKSLGQTKSSTQKLIGFAAETESIREAAQGKLERKNLDIIAANDISADGSGFGTATNQMFILDREGRREAWPQLPKTEVAWRLWDHLLLD